jgi:hypothetical protein
MLCIHMNLGDTEEVTTTEAYHLMLTSLHQHIHILQILV